MRGTFVAQIGLGFLIGHTEMKVMSNLDNEMDIFSFKVVSIFWKYDASGGEISPMRHAPNTVACKKWRRSRRARWRHHRRVLPPSMVGYFRPIGLDMNDNIDLLRRRSPFWPL